MHVWKERIRMARSFGFCGRLDRIHGSWRFEDLGGLIIGGRIQFYLRDCWLDGFCTFIP